MQQIFEKKRKFSYFMDAQAQAFRCFWSHVSSNVKTENNNTQQINNTIYEFACFKKGARNCHVKAKSTHFEKTKFNSKHCAFEKKLVSLVPQFDFALGDEATRLTKNQAKTNQKQNFDFGNKIALIESLLKKDSFNIMLVKACIGSFRGAGAFAFNNDDSKNNLKINSTFKFNSFSNVQCLKTKFGKTNFSKNFVHHFYNNQQCFEKVVKFKKLSGANIELLNIICTGPHVAARNMVGKCVNNRLIKAQCSSLAALLFLKHMVPSPCVSFGASNIKAQVLNKSVNNPKKTKFYKQLLAVNVKRSKEQHVLETMKVVLGALLISHNKLWFISANELTQCCLVFAKHEQNGLTLNAAPVGVTKTLKKSVFNSVAVIKYLLIKSSFLLSQQI